MPIKLNDSAPVSVVIPCFRCADTFSRAYGSVLQQTVMPREVILVDDASGDETAALLKRVATDNPRVRVLTFEENRGPAAARNAGWDAASQALVAFLDADDAWHPRKLEWQISWMERNPTVAMTGHLIAFQAGSDSRRDVPVDAILARRVTPYIQLRSNRFQTSSVVVRRDLDQRFPDGKRYCEDLDLWLRIVLSGLPAFQLQAVLAYTFKPMYGDVGLSAQLWKMERGELDALAHSRRLGLLTQPAFLGSAIWSLCKFAVRCLRTALRRVDAGRSAARR